MHLEKINFKHIGKVFSDCKHEYAMRYIFETNAKRRWSIYKGPDYISIFFGLGKEEYYRSNYEISDNNIRYYRPQGKALFRYFYSLFSMSILYYGNK